LTELTRTGGVARRVFITGVGMTTALGVDRETTWHRLLDGACGVRRVPPAELAARAEPQLWPQNVVAAPALELASWRADDPEADDPLTRLALRAATEAFTDAGLERADLPPQRMGCVVGTSKGSQHAATRLVAGRSHLSDHLSDALAADFWQRFQHSTPALEVARRYRLRGAALCPVAACATGLVSLQRGFELVQGGTCDVVLAGSVDASLHPLLLASYRRMGVHAAPGDDGRAAACRPFDQGRDGFVIGEGAAVLVLESGQSARARGVVPYAEWLAGGLGSDAAGPTHLDPSAADLARLIGEVLRWANVPPEEIDYVNLHGTATRPNDLCETRAVRQAFGPAADRLVCSGLKGALGHLLAAAGSVETACCVLALRDQVIPPTINLTHPDPQCDLDYCPNTPRPRPLRHVQKTSLGFGGHLAAAVLRRPDGREFRMSNSE
jgi:3-oxoacyl-[acyl-carrier-protein] synthase II